MKETSLQQLIDLLQRVQLEGVILSGEDVISSVIIEAKKLLPTERQQIEDAFNAADKVWYDNYEHYFTETYKTI